MQITSMHFKATASAKLASASLQAALTRLQTNFVRGRADRVAEFGNYEEIRAAKKSKERLAPLARLRARA